MPTSLNNEEVYSAAFPELPVATTAQTSDAIALYQSGLLKRADVSVLISAIQSQVYPVGTIYQNSSDSRNPSVILGFPSTWVLHGIGRVLVCVDSQDTDFSALGGETGQKTVSLTEANNGPHAHPHSDPGHGHYIIPVGTNGSEYGLADDATSGSSGPLGTAQSFSNITIQSSGSGTPHNNVQPSKTVWRWTRTA